MFYKTLAIIVLLSLINGFLSESIDNTEDERVIGGSDAEIDKFPYQVSLQDHTNHICGGSIYNHQIIITAAHCVDAYKAVNVSSLSVLLGTSTLASGGLRVPVKSFAKHQWFNRTNLNYDLALIELKSPITFTRFIQPIALATRTPESGAQVVVTGWGVLKNSADKPSPKLQGAQLDFIPRSECKLPPYGYDPNLITPTMICAGAIEKGSCRGDSGGPLTDLQTKKLLGVVSWGPKICTHFPSVFSSIPALANWIKSASETLLRK